MNSIMPALPQFFILIGIIGFLIVVAFIFLQKQRAISVQKRALGQDKSGTSNAQMYQMSQQAYNYAVRVPLLNRLLMRIRKRIEALSVYDERSLRAEVMKILFINSMIAVAFILCLLVLRPSLLVVFWIFIGALFLSGTLIDFFIHAVEEKLLKQLKEFNNRVRYFYQQSKIVDDAIFESIQYAGPEMKAHSERIYEILTSVEPEKELTKYEEIAPTRFLKVIAGLSLLVKEQGDKFTQKGSAYLNGLSSINEELNHEIIYRSKLSYQLRFLAPLALLPIFFALPLKGWAIENFAIMQQFYDSRMGLLSEVIVYLIAISCYFIIRRMREVNEVASPMKSKKILWEKWLFEKAPFISRIIKALSPSQYSKKRFKIQHIIKESNTRNTVEEVTLHRIIIALSIALILTTSFVYSHAREKYGVLNHIVSESFLAGNMTPEDKKYAQELTDFDREVIEYIQTAPADALNIDALRGYIAEKLGIDRNNPKVQASYDRIIEKWNIVKNAYFKWWELLFIIGVAYVFSFVPIWNMRFKKFLRLKEMETEVHQLLILICILKEFDRMSVFIILTWMERFSVVFKDDIQITLQNFDSGPGEALDDLTERITFEPFQQIVERLKLSVVRISIKESFDDIDMERTFYLEQRKEAQNRSIKTKSEVGSMLGLAPVISLTLVYLVIPMLYLSVTKSADTLYYLQ